MSRPRPERAAIELEVRDVLRRHVPVPDGNGWLALDLERDLALESITRVVVLVELEERLGIAVGADLDPAELRTGRDLVDLVLALVQ